MATPEKSKKSDEEILEVAKKRFEIAAEAEAQNREAALEDMKFLAGDQWPQEIKMARDQDRRPCLTINRLPQYSRQIINETRQNRPSIKVNPVDDAADLDTAKVLQGLIRHIEYQSHADIAYDTAFEGAVNKGLGYLRVATDYCDPESFEQDVFIRRVRDSFSVYLDPFSEEPDGSDANWGFVFEDMSPEDYKAEYPDSELAHMADWTSVGQGLPGWVKGDGARVAEYFYKTFKEVEIAMLADKSVVPSDQVKDGMQVVAKRKTTMPAIKWAKINGVEVLDKKDWPGRWIPIIPVLGDELMVNGKRVLEGIIRHAKDPQRMYNYWASAETETIALAPRAPFIGAEGQFEDYEAQWNAANTRNFAFLQYKPVTIDGQMAPPPQRNVIEPPVMAITQARAQSAEDLKATTGIYDATLGNRSNENSGVAIQRRNQQSQTSNFHFVDNLSRALRHAGRIIVDLIPHIYDTPRAVRIIGEDGEIDIVKVNEIFQEGGQDKLYALDKGTYDVTVSTGPSFETKRQEAAETMLEFSKSLPPQQQGMVSDLIAKNMDWPGAELIADRLKKTLPPGMVESDKSDQTPIPPAVQQHLQQMSQQNQQLIQALNQAHDVINTKKMELDSRERIAMAQIEADITKTMATIDQKDAIEMLKAETSHINQRLQTLGLGAQIESQHILAAQAQPPDGESQQQQQPAGGQPAQPME